MTEHVAYIITDTPANAHDIYRHWTLASMEERRRYEEWNIVFKGGEADARHLLARHIQKAGPGQKPRIWTLTLVAQELPVALSRTGIPPYAEGDIITVWDRRHALKYRAEVTDCLLAGARRPWMVWFESLKPVEPHDSRHYCGSLEADDDGTSPHIEKEH